MMIVATDAPLSARQLGRLARRAPLGLARTGFTSNHGSGDYVIAFSTARRDRSDNNKIVQPGSRLVDENKTLNLLFQAAVESVEEAVLNSLVAAETLAGRDGHVAHALPVNSVQSWLKPVIENLNHKEHEGTQSTSS